MSVGIYYSKSWNMSRLSFCGWFSDGESVFEYFMLLRKRESFALRIDFTFKGGNHWF